MAILVTGASGFIGSALIPLLIEKGHRVYGLSRHPPEARERLISLKGDILEPHLGLSKVPKDIRAVHHLAAIHRLGDDKDSLIWKTNVEGTKRVLAFCAEHAIPHHYFCSTAFTLGRNIYEESKTVCELMVRESDIPRKTIFKPSIVMGTAENPYPGHFSRFISAVIHIHQRAELIRRKIEGSLRLPVIEPLFRIRGNPEGKLNLIQIDQVAWGIANIEEAGTFWLTHPDPPTLQQLADWVGELIMVRMKFEPEVKPTPIEAAFQKMTSAFQPYLWGDNFPSNLQLSPPITREFIHDTIKRSLFHSSA